MAPVPSAVPRVTEMARRPKAPNTGAWSVLLGDHTKSHTLVDVQLAPGVYLEGMMEGV